MNSCHEERVRDRNRTGVDPAFPQSHFTRPNRTRSLHFVFLLFLNVDPALRSQLDSGREHPARDMSS
eukprot:gene4575-biopygen12679